MNKSAYLLLCFLICFLFSLNTSAKLLPPTAGFITPDTGFCGSGYVHFINKSVNATKYIWYFGDGDTSHQANPLHFYTSPGRYDVMLVASNNFQNDTITKKNCVNVYSSPIIHISIHDTNVCLNSIDTLLASGAVKYVWQPNNDSAPMYIVSPTSQAIYKVYGWSQQGCLDSAFITLYVHNKPAIFLYPHLATICPGDSITITANGGIKYNWLNPASIKADTVRVSPKMATAYTVVGTDQYGCIDTASDTINLYIPPIISISAQSNNLCLGTPDTLTAYGGIHYTWLPGSANNNPLAILPVKTTTYKVTGIDGNGCAGTDSLTVNVYPYPSAITGHDTAVCAGNPVKMGGSNVKGNIYVWSPIGNLTRDSASSTLATPISTTVYTLTVTNKISGCSKVDSIKITIDTIPYFPLADTGICAGQSIRIGNPAINGYSYKWTPATGLSSSTVSNPILKLQNSGYYAVLVTDNGTGCFAKDSFMALQYVIDSITPITGNAVVHKGDTDLYYIYGVPGFKYLWKISGATILSGQGTDSLTVVWNSSSIDSMSVYATNTCTDTVKYFVNKSTGFKQAGQRGIYHFMIWPNPVTNTLTMRTPGYAEGWLKFDISDAAGRVVYKTETSAQRPLYLVDMSGYSNGLYMLHYTTPSVSGTIKFIKNSR